MKREAPRTNFLPMCGSRMRPLPSLCLVAAALLMWIQPAAGLTGKVPSSGSSSLLQRPRSISPSRRRSNADSFSQSEQCNSDQLHAQSRCKLRVIFVNDVYELHNWPRFRTAVDEFWEENTIVCLPGDFLAPSLISTLDHGKAMISCMNRCGISHVCFGNHETDIPHDELVRRIAESNFTWVNSNMRDWDGAQLPEFDIVEVKGGGQTRRVAVLGLLSDDPGLYRPNAFNGATISPVLHATEKLREQLSARSDVDLVLPMTHQPIADDRRFAAHFAGKGPDKSNAIPLLIAAHDHEPYQEEVAGCKILKTGSDGDNIGICDIEWEDAGSRAVRVTTRLVPARDLAPDPEVQALVDMHSAVLQELDSAPLFLCSGQGERAASAPLTSRGSRLQQSTVGSKLVSALRDGLGSECCVLNAGNIRGDRVYAPDKRCFTYKDLKAEIPFDCEMVVVPLEGRVIAAAVKHSRERSFRDPPEASGGFLQLSDDMLWDDAKQELVGIAGAPIEPERAYRCGVLLLLLTGIDENPALMQWTASHRHLLPRSMALEAGRPAKLVLVDYFSKAIYYQMGSFASMDRGGKGFLSREDIVEAVAKHFGAAAAGVCVDNIMRAADSDRNGVITRHELLRVNFANAWARRDMDQNRDGVLDRAEVEAFGTRVFGKGFDSRRMVSRVFSEVAKAGRGEGGGEAVRAVGLTGAAVARWMAETFQLDSVSVPGQALEREEAKAAQQRLQTNGHPD